MSMEATTANQFGGTDRRIEDSRLAKALSESMDVTPKAPWMYDVTHDGREYAVDIEGGSCTCSDHQYRGERVYCKHQLRGAIHHAFTTDRNTDLVARTLARVRDAGCIHDSTSCNGPTAFDDYGVIPCDHCVEATSTGIWTVWCRLSGNEVRTLEDSSPGDVNRGDGVACDGGVGR